MRDCQVAVEGWHRVADGQAGADRSFGVVFVRHGQSENRQHGVPHQIRDGSSEPPFDHVLNHVVELAYHVAGLFRIQPLGQPGGTHQVRE